MYTLNLCIPLLGTSIMNMIYLHIYMLSPITHFDAEKTDRTPMQMLLDNTSVKAHVKCVSMQ